MEGNWKLSKLNSCKDETILSNKKHAFVFTCRYYCSRNATTPTPDDGGITSAPCTTGHYCPVGTASPIPCAHGTYMTKTHDYVCDICTPGYYCVSGQDPEPCPPGYYCPVGTGIVWQSCPTGTFSINTHQNDSSQCTGGGGGGGGGYYCGNPNSTTVSGECSAGYYCSEGSDTATPDTNFKGTAGPCPAGSYCPQRTTTPQPCPAGRYSNNTKLAASTDCDLCAYGKYCGESGLTTPSGDCWGGFYCLRGAASPNNPTNFCPNGTSYPLECPVGPYNRHGWIPVTVQPCPAGRYSNNAKLAASTDCDLCAYGKYCGESGLTTPSGDCWGGFYCLRGAASPNNPTNDTTGGPCPTGHFCPNGTSYPLECPVGTYNPTIGIAECTQCPAGFFCPQKLETFSSNPCPAGHYCPIGTTHGLQYPCDKCYYNNYTGKGQPSDCIPCEPGRYCGEAGLAYPTAECAEGWYW